MIKEKILAGNEITKIFFSYIGKHFITLSCNYTDTRDGISKKGSRVFSGFVVEIKEIWFFVTAGHVINSIEFDSIHGVTFDSWHLSDQSAGNDFQHAIPYDFNLRRWIVLRDDEKGLDYAVAPLESLIVQLLRAGGAIAVNKNTWQPVAADQCDQWVLLGVPKESVVKQGPGILNAKTTLIPLKSVPAPPGVSQSKVDNMFFAELSLKHPSLGIELDDIDGMSGGPIFGTKLIDGQLRYWLIGVQSGWFQNRRIISACPTSTFMTALEKLLRRHLSLELF